MKKILIRGPLLSNSGYGVHSRQVFKWLLQRKNVEIKCQILSWGNNPWHLNLDYDNGIIKEIVNKSISNSQLAIENFNETYQIQLPNEWIKISEYDVGITAGVESNICNSSLIQHLNKMKKVVVPSNFSKNTFEETAKYFNKNIKTEIIVIPECFPDLFEKELNIKNNSYEKIKTDFNFIVFGQMSSLEESKDRKNTLKTIKCLVDTFKEDKNVGIIVKTNLGKNSKIDKSYCKKIINQYLEINKLNNKKCKLYLVHGNLSEMEILSLYKKSNVLVSGTRGEGYGLSHLEASSLGIPIISTNYSGYKDFLSNDFIKVKYNMTKVKNKSFLFDNKNSQWAEFDYEDMKSKLKEVYINYESYKKKSLVLKNKIKQNYNTKAIISFYSSSLRV